MLFGTEQSAASPKHTMSQLMQPWETFTCAEIEACHMSPMERFQAIPSRMLGG